MPSIPLTPDEEKAVLKKLKLQNMEDLFSAVPPKIRENADFVLEPARGMTEHELRKYFYGLAAKNAHFPATTHFLGGGIYDNIIPAIVNQIALRGEFLTCYTPYQPEVSQGTLQVIFEFQTMIARITGMPVSNASMYDGSTALTEACLMAQRLSSPSQQTILMAAATSPDYKEVCRTFMKCHSNQPVEIPWNNEGTLDLVILEKMISEQKPCAVAVSYPNFFGMIEPLDKIKAMLPKGCLLIVNVPDISALSIFEAPGRLGADIVVGEAHQLGTPMSFGGPHVGFFATKKEFIRQMPGRLCGESVDSEGRRAYTLTLSTREQHIRREKATSNICTNQGLIALRTTIYLSFLGKQGFKRLGEINYSLFDYLAKTLEAHGIPLQFKSSLNYREGVFTVPQLESRFEKALQKGIIPGIRMSTKFDNTISDFNSSLLICVHPKHTKQDIDALVEAISHD